MKITTVFRANIVGSLLLLLLGFLRSSSSLSVASALPTDTKASTVDHARAMIEWVRSKGGFVSNKVEIRRRDPTDISSPMGVFAKEPLVDEELILHVPRECYISLPREESRDNDLFSRQDTTMEEVMVGFYGNTCKLGHRILEEQERYRQDPSSSNYGPFMAYLESIPRGQLPATYTSESKAILRDMLGYRTSNETSPNYGHYTLPPYQLESWIDNHLIQKGCFEDGDKEAEHAAATAIQRGYDTELIPIWDMFNHDNGKRNVDTETSTLRSDKGVQVYTTKAVAVGDELFASYNECEDCYDVVDDWGTPGIFRDFGFVEGFPQVWPFLDHNILYQVIQNENGTIRAKFYEDDSTGELIEMPDRKGLKFMRRELRRLLDLDLAKLDHSKIPEQEWYWIQRYYEALVSALDAGIEETVAIKGAQYFSDTSSSSDSDEL